MGDKVDQFGLFREALHSDEIEIRVNALKKLNNVAEAIGLERTKNELLPLLKEESLDNEDEALKEMGTSLGLLCPFLGGGSNCVSLLPILKNLCTQEETVVREEAVNSMLIVIKQLSGDDVSKNVMPLLQELSDGDWFTSRVSASALLADIYKKLSSEDDKSKIRELFRSLCNDDTPMVRRAAANHLGLFTTVLEPNKIVEEIIPLFKQLVSDDQDSVRLLAIEKCKDISATLSTEQNVEHLLPLIKSCAEDKSWKVRQTIAKDFSVLAKKLGTEKTANEMLPFLSNFLTDPEAEVRASGVKAIPGFLEVLGKEQFKNSSIISFLIKLSEDSSGNVKSNVAQVSMEISKDLSKEVLPIIQNLLPDDTSDVRLGILTKLKSLVESNDKETIQTVLPTILALCDDKQWRIRETIASQLVAFGRVMGVEYYESNLLPKHLQFLEDTVTAVRTQASDTLTEVVTLFGENWTQKMVIPKLKEIYDRSSYYLKRITILLCIQSIGKALKGKLGILQDVFPLILQSTSDPIPNVRFVAADTLGLLASLIDKSLADKDVKPALTKLSDDKDKDVQYYATIALSKF